MAADSITSMIDKITKDGSCGYKAEKRRKHIKNELENIKQFYNKTVAKNELRKRNIKMNGKIFKRFKGDLHEIKLYFLNMASS